MAMPNFEDPRQGAEVTIERNHFSVRWPDERPTDPVSAVEDLGRLERQLRWAYLSWLNGDDALRPETHES